MKRKMIKELKEIVKKYNVFFKTHEPKDFPVEREIYRIALQALNNK